METKEFIRIATSFADSKNKVVQDKDTFIFQVREELITISLKMKDGDLLVVENGDTYPARTWIINRLARVSVLADRIIEHVSPEQEEHFICPSGKYLGDINKGPDEQPKQISNPIDTIVETINDRSPLCTTVMYLTSDAGEGKTTLINELAKTQALRFKAKEADWLLVPISLGGRPFLRFDEVIISALNGKFRFLMFYFDSFVELVKMGVIVPAFDGFEEMFMESSSGEALSALGSLLNKLDSQGTLLLAARKAYFEYQSFSIRAKLYDSISTNYFSFSRISLDRWNKEHFIEYGKKRRVFSPEKVHSILAIILGEEHPILTRAVLVKQVFDSFTTEKDFTEFSKKIRTDYSYQYFNDLVFAIIEREATQKWINRSGDPAEPLISSHQHLELLAMVAEEMWIQNTEYISADVLDFNADLFSEKIKASPDVNRQVRERIKQHALITHNSFNGDQFSFDHEEFRQHFIGVAVSQKILSLDHLGVRNIFSVRVISEQTIDAIICEIKGKVSIESLIQFSEDVCKSEGMWSFLRQNLGSVIIKLLNEAGNSHLTLNKLIFPSNALKHMVISRIWFKGCFFHSTSLEGARISGCTFENCSMDGIEFYINTEIQDAQLLETEIKSVYDEQTDQVYYDPTNVRRKCIEAGFSFSGDASDKVTVDGKIGQDEELVLTMRMIKRFLKNSSLNEAIFKSRLGKKYQFFEGKVLPRLLETKILVVVRPDEESSGVRFRLGKHMKHIDEAMAKCNGKFESFLNYLRFK